MSKLTILNQLGDEVLTWDRELAEAVEGVVTSAEARAAFDQMKTDGKYLAYKIDNKGDAEVIKEFDESAAEIVMSPQMQGG
jgi:hypothetical protein